MVDSSVPRPGEPAPDFTLPSTAGTDVTLSSFQGQSNVLLAFFPLAFTSVCTTEMCDFTDELAAFAGMNATVLGISVDSIPTLKEFQAKYQIGIDLLSDFRREVSTLYGTLLQDPYFSNRAYFAIDKQGIVRWSHVEENPGHKRGNRELLDRLATLA